MRQGFELKRALKRKISGPQWHNLRSTTPISKVFGFDRGKPVGRYYIEKFLNENRHLITGNVLEIAESTYSRNFGTDVQSYNVLHFTDDNSNATIIGDLTDISTLPENSFDCFICTQTLNFIYNLKDAVKGAHYLLKDGGVVMATVAGLIQISRYDMDRWGDYWRFNTLSAYKLFSEIFGKENVTVQSYGNVMSCISILEGLASEELTREELDYRDEDYQLIVSVIARKVKR